MLQPGHGHPQRGQGAVWVPQLGVQGEQVLLAPASLHIETRHSRVNCVVALDVDRWAKIVAAV